METSDLIGNIDFFGLKKSLMEGTIYLKKIQSVLLDIQVFNS